MPYVVDAGSGLQYVGSVSVTALGSLNNIPPSEPHCPIRPRNPLSNLHGQLCGRSCSFDANNASQFDKNGATGGCQDDYTMYPSQSTSQPNCSNITLPTNTLDVTGVVENGPLSPNGWVPQVINPDPSSPHSSLIRITVYGHLPYPQKWNTAV